MNRNRFIALDLELEQPNDGDQITDSNMIDESIIQVGWVVFERMPFKAIKTASYFVDIGCPLSSFIKQLTRITDEDIKNGTSISKIYRELVKDREEYDTSRIIRQWGGGDMGCLREEAEPYGIKWEFGGSGFNVKHLYQEYADIYGLNRSGGLSKCISRLDLLWQGHGKHQAHIDALNTAVLYSKIYQDFFMLKADAIERINKNRGDSTTFNCPPVCPECGQCHRGECPLGDITKNIRKHK